jgi:hypothetical protein
VQTFALRNAWTTRLGLYTTAHAHEHTGRTTQPGYSQVRASESGEQLVKGSVTTNPDTRQRELQLTSVLSEEACLTCTVKHFTRAQRGINTIQGGCSYSQESEPWTVG